MSVTHGSGSGRSTCATMLLTLSASIACVGASSDAASHTPADTAAQHADTGWRARFVAAAAKIRFGAERPPMPDSETRYTKRVETGFTIASVTDLRPEDRGRRLARVTARSEYPRLGLGAGVSYLWMEPGNDTILYVIPATPSARVRTVAMRPHSVFHRDSLPRLVLVSALARETMKTAATPTTMLMSVCEPTPIGWRRGGDTTADLRAYSLNAEKALLPYVMRHAGIKRAP